MQIFEFWRLFMERYTKKGSTGQESAFELWIYLSCKRSDYWKVDLIIIQIFLSEREMWMRGMNNMLLP